MIEMDREEFKNEDAVKQALEEARKLAEEAAAMEDEKEEETEEVAEEASEEAAEEVSEEASEECTEECSGEEEAEEQEKKGFFGKMKKDKKDKKDVQIEELTDRVKRQMAEFDNFRKRTEKEKQAMFEVGAKSVIEKMLPVIDNFERGLAAVTEEQKEDAFVQGVEMTYKQLMTTLESIEVRQIEAVGKEFDPNLHNAVMHVDDENLGENIIAEEFQKGYTYRDTVVRHSMVKVAN